MILSVSEDVERRCFLPDISKSGKWTVESKGQWHLPSLFHRDTIPETLSIETQLYPCELIAMESDFAHVDVDGFFKYDVKRTQIIASNSVKSSERERRNLHLIQSPQKGHMSAWREGLVEKKTGWHETWDWTPPVVFFCIVPLTMFCYHIQA